MWDDGGYHPLNIKLPGIKSGSRIYFKYSKDPVSDSISGVICIQSPDYVVSNINPEVLQFAVDHISDFPGYYAEAIAEKERLLAEQKRAEEARIAQEKAQADLREQRRKEEEKKNAEEKRVAQETANKQEAAIAQIKDALAKDPTHPDKVFPDLLRLKFPHMKSFTIGDPMVSTGGLIPEGIRLTPVRIEFEQGQADAFPHLSGGIPYVAMGTVYAYLYQDEFHDWNCNIKGTEIIINLFSKNIFIP